MALKTHAFDPTSLDAAAEPGPPSIYVSRSIGSFSLAGRSGHAIFVWYHEDGTIDGHTHALAFKGTARLGSATFDVYAADGTDHEHGLFLFAREQLETDEGYRVFYAIHGHLHLWTWDAVRFPAHAH
jgi:hypothetical protein